MRQDTPSLDQVIDQGLRLHSAGDLAQAEQLYLQVLKRDPANGDALHLLGLIAYQNRSYEKAVKLMRRAIAANDQAPMYHNNLGLALRGLGEQEKAAESFRRALALDSGFPEAEANLGRLLHDQENTGEAEVHYRHSLTLDPGCVEALEGLGRLLMEKDQPEEALVCHRRVLALHPGHAGALGNLGNVLEKMGKPDEALDCYRRALAIDPQLPQAYINIGNLLLEQGRLGEAVEQFRRALELAPDSAPAHNGLGIALHDLGHHEDATAEYRRAHKFDPRSADACNNLGEALREEGRIEEAARYFRQALAIKPADGLRIKLATLLPVIAESNEEISGRRAAFERSVSELLQENLRLRDPVKEVGVTNFYLAYHGMGNRDPQMQVARLYEQACPSLLWEAPHCRGKSRRPGPIRIGFISKFFHQHSIGKTSSGLIDQLDRRRFRVYTLALPPVPDDELARFIRSRSDEYIELPGNLESARQRIAALELDVLFYQDIGMEPFTYFLAFARLAPVQCVSYGHPDTTGIRHMDYFISNDLFETDGAAGHYCEKLALLHDLGTLAYYYRPRIPATLKDRAAFGLPAAAHLYLCPQNLFKLHPDFDGMIGGILRADPEGRLVLIEGKYAHWTELLRRRLERRLPDVSGRILWVPRQNQEDFLSLCAISDVVLDTPHFNGMNSSLETFATGTPIVTLPMALQRTRHTSGMYRKMGLLDGVAANPEDYVKIAVRIGTDPYYRRSLRERILAANSVLYEDPGVVKEFERFFTEAVAAAGDGR